MKIILFSLLCLAVFANDIFAEEGLVADDPFSKLDQEYAGRVVQSISDNSKEGFFTDNFTFKKEIFSQFSYGPEAQHETESQLDDRLYSRQSLGLEVLKKFSDSNSTYAALNFQLRAVRRDNYIEVLNDIEGEDRDQWFFEYHNLYIDFYNFLNPFFTEQNKTDINGHFNFRLGRFYVPFGLNLQTDTHGTLLQLSNERNFGFERDWYSGFWGSINKYLNYDLYYLLGSGYDASFAGQDGLLATRVSLSNYFLNEHGLEAGLSLLSGQRQSDHALDRSSSVSSQATNTEFIQTIRYGIDARYSHLFINGSLSWMTELSLGKDEEDDIASQLYQIEYLHKSRKWALASQYREFHQGLGNVHHDLYDFADSSIIFELSWFFRNDIGNANLHWIKLNLEKQLERIESDTGTVTTIQYYRYW